jgi:hypothetical protein
MAPAEALGPFLDRRTDRVAGIFGSISVVSANAWMNAPAGFTLDSNGNVIEVDPVRVIFNDSMPWQRLLRNACRRCLGASAREN